MSSIMSKIPQNTSKTPKIRFVSKWVFRHSALRWEDKSVFVHVEGARTNGTEGRQAVEGGKWGEKEGKESKKELHCLVLI